MGKRLLGLFLVLCLVLSLVSVNVLGEEADEDITVIVEESGLSGETEGLTEADTETDPESIIDGIEIVGGETVSEGETDLTVCEEDVMPEEFVLEEEILEPLRLEVPEENDPVTEQKVQEKVNQLVQLCEASGADTDYRKALWFHDWLIKNANYDYTYTEYGPEGVLLKGTGVCQSYTLAYKALLDAVGINSIVVTSVEMNHAWNIVKIGDIWTHIDCTWDDPDYGGFENHSYFGLSDDEMGMDHTWDRTAYPACGHIQREVSIHELPDPYDLNAPVEGIDFAFLDTSGNMLTRQDVEEEHTLLIFGRDGCGNTRSFINEITPWASVLAENGLKVIVVYETSQEAGLNDGKIPFTCVSEADPGYARWEFLQRIGITGVYTYPLIILQNRQGYAFYYSTGYVNDPERVLATALKDLPETQEIHTHQWITVPALGATCQSAGYTEYCYCGSCGMVLTEQSVIPPTEHAWSDWVTFTEATVFAPEQQHRNCLTCGMTETRSSGKSLAPSMTVNASAVIMQTGQSTTKLRVSDLALGDAVKSWESGNTKILKVTGKADGTCRLKAMNKSGSAVIMITLQSGLKKTISVKVQKGKVKTKSIIGVKKNVTLKKGKTLTLDVSLNPITSQDKITFATSNKKAAAIDKKGVIKGVAPGKAKITVKAGGKKVVCNVKVVK